MKIIIFISIKPPYIWEKLSKMRKMSKKIKKFTKVVDNPPSIWYINHAHQEKASRNDL